MRIITKYDPPPIPGWQSMAWYAIDDHTYGGDPGDPIGFGATEQAAIDDLLEQLGDGLDDD